MLIPSYEPLEKTLKRKRKNKMDLRNDLKLAPATVSKIAKNDWISMDKIALICWYLQCEIQDVVIFIPLENANKDH